MRKKHPKPIRKLPSKGWTVTNAADLLPLGEYPGACDRCGRKDLRYVHVLEHPDWPDPILVGRCCSQKLSQGYDAASAEYALILQTQRRERFPDLQGWRVSANGNPWINYRGATLTVFLKEDGFRFCVALEDQRFYGNGFESIRDAKLAAFDCLAELLEDGGH